MADLGGVERIGNATTFAYDAAGNVTTVTDAELRVSRYVYDDMNRLVTSIDATNTDPNPPCGVAGVTCFAYDASGNLGDLTDANGNVTSFDYDTRERAVARTDPLLHPETFDYDANGNLRFVTDRKGQVIEFQYDIVNRWIAKIMQPGTPDQVVRDFAYDLADNLTSVVDPDSALNSSYDLLDRRTSIATTGAPFQPDVTLSYSYDANDNRLTLTDPTGQTDYLFDALNRLNVLTAPGLVPITFDYDALSRLTGRSLPNGTDTALTYDVAGRLAEIAHVLGPTAISSFGYLYDKTDNRFEQNQQRTAVAVAAPQSYLYDDLERLIQATDPLAGMADETFTYDPVGNRLIRDGQATNSLFDAGDRLLEDDDFCYAYDLNGNLATKTTKVAGACTGAATGYTHDAEDRMIRIDFPGGGFAAYRFDGLHRRIEKNVDGVLTRYVYDRDDILLEYDGIDNLVARYTHGPEIDNPLVMERDLDVSGTFEASERFAYHTDALGSVTELTDSAGAAVQAYVYDSYGQIVQQVGTMANPYAYTGREFDVESGLYFHRARYYDAHLGRFLQEDPIKGFMDTPQTLNLYPYVANNPLNFVDPDGLESGKKGKKKSKMEKKRIRLKKLRERNVGHPKGEEHNRDTRDRRGFGGIGRIGPFILLLTPPCVIDPSLCSPVGPCGEIIA